MDAGLDTSSLELGDNTYKPQSRVLTFLFRHKDYPIPKDDERTLYPEKQSNWLSRLFFWWVNPLLNVGYYRTLQPNDLFILTDEMKVERQHEIFQSYFEVELARAIQLHLAMKCEKRRNETLTTSSVSEEQDLDDFKLSAKSMYIALFLTMKRRLIVATALATLCLAAIAVSPFLTKKLINFVEGRALGIYPTVNKGIGYAIGSVLLSLVSGFLFQHYFYLSGILGAQVKALLTKAILKKSFKLDAQSRHKFTQAKITSLITTDLARIELGYLFHPLLVCLPVPVVLTIIILIINIRVSAVIGIVIFIIFLGIISVGAAKMFALRDAVSKVTDRRVNIMKEILNNLKMIKYYSWEHPYLQKVTNVRNEEVDMIMQIQTLRNIIFSLAMTLTGICSMIAFVILWAINGETSSAANIFSSVSAFEILGLMVFFIPQALSTTLDMLLGFRRVGALLSAPEEKHYPGYNIIEDSTKDDQAIVLKDASFSWATFDDNESKGNGHESDDYESDDDDTPAQKKAKKKQRKLKKKLEKKETKRKAKLAKKQGITVEELEKRENTDEKTLVKNEKSEKKQITDQTTFAGLRNINLDIKKGEFVVITGAIGSGKSSLLNAISGFMTCEGGEIDIYGSLLLCGAPWIQNTTIRENITFGSPLEQKTYDDVIYACALNIDLDNLGGGDLTEVGEKGITLSGGQKARINLARAVYANRDILLLDDVLSAVDARVGKHILNNCLLGYLKNKTRILATHQLSLIGQADRIIFLNGDGTIDVGTLEELTLRNAKFDNLMQHSKLENTNIDDFDIESNNGIDNDCVRDKDEKGETKRENGQFIGEIDEDTNTYQEHGVGDDEIGTKYSHSLQNITRELTNGHGVGNNTNYNQFGSNHELNEEYRDYNLNKDAAKGKLIVAEERAENSLKFEVYKNYIKFGAGKMGTFLFITMFVFLLTIATFCDIFTNTWLSFWISNKFPGRSSGFYIGIYVMFTLLWVIFLTLTFLLFIRGTTTSSKIMNIKAINRILYAPMSFMDTTPMGRILNRFTKDADALDNEISDNLRMLFQAIAKLIGVLILLIIYIPWFACALPAIFIVFFLIANYYQASNRETKRIEAILRSFVYNNVNEMLSGMNTIKSYKDVSRFDKRGDDLLNTANEATFIVSANQRWLGIHLDLLAQAVFLLVCLLCVNRVFDVSAASTGLLITYTTQMAGELNNLFRSFTMAENDMNSAERICHYALKLDQEAPYKIDANAPPSNWPESGAVEFVDANMRYRPGLPLVLKNLSVEIKPNEKIGICGRTGAGKSSIMTALFRLAELSSGKIVIDGVDISTIGLQDLRSKLSIIPQDPVLFNGTIRSNLDPFDEHTDEVLLESLRRAGILTVEELNAAKAITKNGKDKNNGEHGSKPKGNGADGKSESKGNGADGKIESESEGESELPKFHLYRQVEDEGENFSLGERQLISFARALVRDSKIIVLDEATSSVDYKTDSRIQQTIATEFQNCTILCIAHRLKTIVGYDKILVMDKGSMLEYDTPWNLFNKVGGAKVFREMCDKSNIVEADFVNRG